MLYIKLIFRGILRHKKRGLKFFILLSICFMMVIFSLSFQDSFYEGYEKLGIDARNAHITILSPESIWLKDSFTSIQKEGLPLLKIDNDFHRFINNLHEVEVGTPIIEVAGIFYTMEGKVQTGGTITGVRASDFKRIFPGITLIKGNDDISVKPGVKNIPFLRWDIQRSEIIQNIDKFVIEDFKVSGDDLEKFKNEFLESFPNIFKTDEYKGAEGTQRFIDELNSAIVQKNFYTNVPKSYTVENNFDVRYIIKQIQTLPFENQSQVQNWNKRLVQSLYPSYINEVPEGISLNKPMSVFIPNAGKVNSGSRPSLIPIEFVGYCEGIPEFYGYNFIDLEVLQKNIGLNSEECTSYLIRLKDTRDLSTVMSKVNEYIKSRGLNYKVVDYKYLGSKTHMPIAIAINYVFKCLIFLFVLISVFFVSYTVIISLIRRRKEMGTVIAIGMSRIENTFIFIGENIVIITLAWVIASVIMGFVITLLSKVGLSGIVFFPKGKLYFVFKHKYFYYAYFLIIIPAIFAALIPSLKIYKINIVDLLKGEISKHNKSFKANSKRQMINTFDSRILLTLKLSIRNIFANRRRSTIIFAIFASVITLLYLLLAFSNGAVSNFRNGFQALNNPRSDIIATEVGYSDLYKTNSNSDKLKDMTIQDSDSIMQELQKLDFVKDVYKKTIPVNLDLYINGNRFKSLSFRGVDVSMYNYLLKRIDVVEGRMIKPEDENVMILNIVNKSELKAGIGDKITVLGNDLYNHAVAEEFTVIGYYKPKIDNPFFTTLVFSDFKGYNTVSGYRNDEVNFLNIDIKEDHSLESSVKKLNLWASENKVDIEFTEFGKIYVQDDEKYGAAKMMIILITYLVIFFVMIGIINMILVNLFDRRKEIGTYYCIGADKSLLISMYTGEILIINILATVVGTLVGFLLQLLINSMKFSSSNPGVQLIFGGNIFYMDYDLTTIVMLFISVLIITLAISLTALRSSLKVSPRMALLEIEE